MTAAAMVLLTAALCIWLAPASAILGAAVRSKLEQREDAKRRTEQGRDITPEWLALLAATESTPIYDRMVCEAIEREEWA